MQDFFGSVRRSSVFRTPTGGEDGGFGGLVDKIASSIRKSRIGLFSQPPVRSLPPVSYDDEPPIRWRKGELIGSGAFGQVFMGMNLDTGELLAVKRVLIAANSASKDKIQAHIRELEEEVRLLKNLKHPNIVRYLGTVREENSLDILLEFVPGGSIASLLGKFGSFPESVIRMYTKQLLLGLEYLHKNGIMHRDIKGANILVDNKGCIKLADFGASKKVVELATINGAKSMKGTPYWMAPEVMLQTGHSFSADIWSVGCTVIEMATGKPPWIQLYKEVAALILHIGMTKSHPPIPAHLSSEAKDFLSKCLQEEPNLRPSASDLLQHPFVTGKCQEGHPLFRGSVLMGSGTNFVNLVKSCTGLKDVCEMGSLGCSTINPGNSIGVSSFPRIDNSDDDMCLIDDKDDLLVGESVKSKPLFASDDIDKSFNPICEPSDDWPCKLDENSEIGRSGMDFLPDQTIHKTMGSPESSIKQEMDFTIPDESVTEDDDEVTESKIRAFLDAKASELKKLQTPLYEEFFSISNVALSPVPAARSRNSNVLHMLPKISSTNRLSRRFSMAFGANVASPGSHTKRLSKANNTHDQPLREIQPPQLSECKELPLGAQQESFNLGCGASFSERQRKWKQELVEELERQREMMRQAGGAGRTPSPKECILNRQNEHFRFA